MIRLTIKSINRNTRRLVTHFHFQVNLVRFRSTADWVDSIRSTGSRQFDAISVPTIRCPSKRKRTTCNDTRNKIWQEENVWRNVLASVYSCFPSGRFSGLCPRRTATNPTERWRCTVSSPHCNEGLPCSSYTTHSCHQNIIFNFDQRHCPSYLNVW